MTRDDLKCVVDQACVSNAAGPDYLWPGSPLEPRLWEALRIEMQSRYRRSTGETMAVLRVDLSEEACRTCDGTGKEGRHSLCRDCDDHQPPLVRDAADKIDRLGAPAPEYHVPCPCTLIEQDEDCPVGYPSLLCGVCKGIGNTTQEQVTALACEMIKIASDTGEPEDPFAAWETIDLIKSQHGQLRKAVEELKFALFSSDMTIKDRADQSARLILAATTEGQR